MSITPVTQLPPPAGLPEELKLYLTNVQAQLSQLQQDLSNGSNIAQVLGAPQQDDGVTRTLKVTNGQISWS